MDNNIEVDEPIKCFFCNETKNDHSLFHLVENNKLCKCDPLVHQICLDKWYIRSGKKCPICSETYSWIIIKDEYDYYLFRCIPFYRIFQCGIFGFGVTFIIGGFTFLK